MEYQTNSKRNQPNSSGTNHFTESNAGHITVTTTSPFLNKIKDSEFSVIDQGHKSKKNHSAAVLNKKLPKEIGSGTSKMLINQILGDNNIDKEVITNINKPNTEKSFNEIDKRNYDQNFIISRVSFRNSTPTLNSQSFSMQRGSCSREDSINPSSTSTNEKKVCSQMNNATYSNKQYDEKTTYCRPSKNRTLEYINKTVERNNKLERLVKQLIDARKKEKQTEAWNNYINELKNKHGYGDSGRNVYTGQYTFEEASPPEYIDDYYDTQAAPKLSRPCKELLNEFYEAYNTVQYDGPYKSTDCRTPRLPFQSYRSHLNHSNCYPMSSQGRLIMLKREKNRNPYTNDWNQPSKRPFHGNTIYVDRDPTLRANSNRKRILNKNCTCEKILDSKLTSTSVQTNKFGIVICVPSTSNEELRREDKLETKEVTTKDKYNPEENMKDVYNRVSENVDRLKKKIQETCNIDTSDLQHTVLQSIESKLDTLLTSINSFIAEVKSKTYPGQSRCYDCRSVRLKPVNNIKTSKNVMGQSRSDTYGLIKAEKLACGLISETPKSSVMKADILNSSHETNIDKILIEEMKSSSRAKNEIESIISGKVGNCSVQISIEIPTKERSTEVTDSLSRAVFQLEDKSVSIEEIRRAPSASDRNMTIAVNTDPLGLLALLRVSTEAVKQLLSYMPNIPYHQYLTMLNFPQRREVSQYVCNICGAAFGRPSQLSDHIRSHNLGRTRDCCVCRHVLDIQRHRQPGLFRCQHCGQRFTRAYCCELHQESCARQLGKRHDVTPSLMLLR